MPTSKKRGGAKAHQKRVDKRNKNISLARKQFEQKYTKMVEERIKELQEKYSGLTESEIESEIESETENPETV